MHTMKTKPYKSKRHQQSYSGNLADTSNIIGEIAGSNISHFPLRSIGTISSTKTTSLQLISRANNHITTRTTDISGIFNFSLRPIKDNIEATVPRLRWYNGTTFLTYVYTFRSRKNSRIQITLMSCLSLHVHVS